MADTLKSAAITNLDAAPYVANTAGEGAPGRVRSVEGAVQVTAAGIATQYSSYRMCRIPVNAKIKRVTWSESTELDTYASGATLVLDFNIAWSDSTIDGTSSTNQGLIPTTANTGAVTGPPLTAYASPNIIFGTFTQVYNVVAKNIDQTFAGSNYAYTGLALASTDDPNAVFTAGPNIPIWQFFYQSAASQEPFYQGSQNYEPNGFFDLMIVVSTAAHTGAAGTLFARVEYVE